MNTELLLSIIAILLGAIGYFIKRILDRTEKIGDDVAEIKPKVSVLWELQFAESHSPLTLNEKGKDILSKSGIKEFVNKVLVQLVDSIKEKNPKNAYQIQEFAKEVMSNVKINPEILPRLQKGAFDTGVDVDTVLFVGSLYLRDLALPKFNFKLEDIDDQKVSI